MEVLSPSSSFQNLDRSSDSHFLADGPSTSLAHLRRSLTNDKLSLHSSSRNSLDQDIFATPDETPMSSSGYITPSTHSLKHNHALQPKALHLALDEITNLRSGPPSPALVLPSQTTRASSSPQVSPIIERRSATTFSFFEEPAEVDEQDEDIILHVPVASTSQLPPSISVPAYLRTPSLSSPKRSHSSPSLCCSAPASQLENGSILGSSSSLISPAATPFQDERVVLPRQMSDSALVQSMTIPESGYLPSSAQHKSERRYWALLELVSTEEGYVQDLRILIQIYFDTLAFLPTATPECNATIRRNADALLLFHERLSRRLNEIDDRIHWRADHLSSNGAWDDDKVLTALEEVSNIIQSEAANFTLYEDFCAKHADAMILLRQYESHKTEWEPYQQNCAFQIATRFPTSVGFGPRLRIRDYAIKPIQRICRYPMMLTGLEKLVDLSIEEEEKAAVAVQKATNAVKAAAEAVDAAKTQMEVERKSALVAKRLEVPQSIQPTFLSVLGYVHMIGALYLVQYPSADNPNLKVKYYGAFLYTTHLVLVKVKRADSYEPRHWLPLRAFEVEAMPDEGAFPFSFRLVHGDQRFDFAATGLAEKNLWIKRLTEASGICREAWAMVGDAAQHFDETTISSIPVDYHQMPLSPDLSGSAEDAALTDEEDGSAPKFGPGASVPFHLRSRLSQSTLTFLGRTPSANRATIDSRLSDVFSDECLTARAANDRSSSPDSRLSSRQHKRQQSAPSSGAPSLIRRATTKEHSMGPRRKSFADTIKPPIQPDGISKARRLSADALNAPQTQSRPFPLARSKTTSATIAYPEITKPQIRRSWGGTLRLRTKSLLGSPSLSDSTFAVQPDAGVARNGSHSSSGSSHPSEVHTPSLSPASTAPPSPIITPQDNHWGLRGVLGSLSRKASFSDGHRSRAGPTLGSIEQDAQAVYASDFLYGDADKAGNLKKDGWRSKRNSATNLSGHRQSSSSSLLSLFRPKLSPSFERGDPMESALPTTVSLKTQPSLDAVNDAVSRSLLSSGTTRRKSIKAFRQLVRMTTTQ